MPHPNNKPKCWATGKRAKTIRHSKNPLFLHYIFVFLWLFVQFCLVVVVVCCLLTVLSQFLFLLATTAATEKFSIRIFNLLTFEIGIPHNAWHESRCRRRWLSNTSYWLSLLRHFFFIPAVATKTPQSYKYLCGYVISGVGWKSMMLHVCNCGYSHWSYRLRICARQALNKKIAVSYMRRFVRLHARPHWHANISNKQTNEQQQKNVNVNVNNK